MGRPIKKSWFGDPDSPGSQIVVNGIKWKDGTTSVDGYIISQTGSRAYMVTDGVKSEIVFLANAVDVATLKNSQAFILAKPFGGTELPCYKIAQYRLSVYNDPENDNEINSYTWSTIPAVKIGQADLVTLEPPVVKVPATGTAVSILGRVTNASVGAGGSGYTTATVAFSGGGGTGAAGTAVLTGDVVTSITVTAPGSGYTGVPAITITGDGTGATATAIVTGSPITAVTITNPGSGYTIVPSVTFSSGTATATATLTAGVVTAIAVGIGGAYTTLPSVIIAAP